MLLLWRQKLDTDAKLDVDAELELDGGGRVINLNVSIFKKKFISLIFFQEIIMEQNLFNVHLHAHLHLTTEVQENVINVMETSLSNLMNVKYSSQVPKDHLLFLLITKLHYKK